MIKCMTMILEPVSNTQKNCHVLIVPDLACALTRDASPSLASESRARTSDLERLTHPRTLWLRC